jgi:hypothetical protein
LCYDTGIMKRFYEGKSFTKGKDLGGYKQGELKDKNFRRAFAKSGGCSRYNYSVSKMRAPFVRIHRSKTADSDRRSADIMIR